MIFFPPYVAGPGGENAVIMSVAPILGRAGQGRLGWGMMHGRCHGTVLHTLSALPLPI